MPCFSLHPDQTRKNTHHKKKIGPIFYAGPTREPENATKCPLGAAREPESATKRPPRGDGHQQKQ